MKARVNSGVFACYTTTNNRDQTDAKRSLHKTVKHQASDHGRHTTVEHTPSLQEQVGGVLSAAA
jgi:membrane carboxypeptidase/penicillin-binding protein